MKIKKWYWDSDVKTETKTNGNGLIYNHNGYWDDFKKAFFPIVSLAAGKRDNQKADKK